MPVSAKGSLELGLGLIVVGVRCAKATVRRVRRPAVEVGSVEATAVTTVGRVVLTLVAPEHGLADVGPQYRYSVDVDTLRSGYVAALLDRGTASAVIVPSIDAIDRDVVIPEIATAVVQNLRTRTPWLRRASIALHPDDATVSRGLRLRGFSCEGDVPGYVEDAPGTRRQLWTAMLG